jgi:hypothetical protein
MAARTVSCNAPEAAIIHNNLGHLLLETGRNDEAAREFEAARKVLRKRLPARGTRISAWAHWKTARRRV